MTKTKDKYIFDKVNHIHSLNGKPLMGTSSMSKVLSKDGLTWWASGLACAKFGWISKGNSKVGWTKKEDRLNVSKKRREEISKLDDEGYLNLLDEAYKAHSTKLDTSASAGTDMHEIMEVYVKECLRENKGKPIKKKVDDEKLQILIDWAVAYVDKFLWSEAHCYSKKLWLGGISDVGYISKTWDYGILDFKSAKDAYLNHFWQGVGYAIQIEENGLVDKDGKTIFTLDKPISEVAVLPFGMDKPEVKFYYNMKDGKEAVKSMLILYKLLYT